MENAHSAFFVVVMHPKEAAGDRTCESADQTDQFLPTTDGSLHEQAIEKGWFFF